MSEFPIFYSDTNKSGKMGFVSGKLSKMAQRPYNLVQKSELHSFLVVLLHFPEPLNIIIDSQ